MKDVRNTVNNAVLGALSEGQISEKDKTLITGLNENNNQMHAHVFKPVVPYVYPLFKIHKLSALHKNYIFNHIMGSLNGGNS